MYKDILEQMNRKKLRKKILEAYIYWQENLERRMAAVTAAKEKLEEQIERDTVNTPPTGTSPIDEQG